ncbi:MAG: glycosyltransferase family 2 protein [Actinomycetota bacterium]|nr:glycosyltransferase family 2 protein [Actinomycetota bacterium]
MSHDYKRVSIVVPVYCEEANLPDFFARLDAGRSAIEALGCNVEVVINDNASTDGSWRLIQEYVASHDSTRGQRLARNYGFQGSVLHGLTLATGDAAIVLQSDLQDPPELIELLVARWIETHCLVVAAVPRSRQDSVLLRSARSFFYRLLDSVSDNRHVAGLQDFYLLDSVVLQEITRSPLSHQFIRGRVTADFGVDEVVEYDRAPRVGGRSSFTFSRLYGLALDGLLLYGRRLLRLVTVGAFSLALLCIAMLLVIGGMKLAGVDFGLAGWTSLAMLLSLLLAATLAGFGLAFEYLIRIYQILVAPVEVSYRDMTSSEE